LAQSVGKVWTLSPTFRAEKSDTARHLSEFYMLEAEVSFVDNMAGVMDLIEDMLRHLTTQLIKTPTGNSIINGRRTGESGLEHERTALSQDLITRWRGMMAASWPRITYTEAINILQKSSHLFQHKPLWGLGLQAEHERFIAINVGQGSPVFVTQYPKAIKPFYMLDSAIDGSLATGLSDPRATVECFDLLVPESCEIVGGSMREHRLPHLLRSMYSHGLITSSAGKVLAPEILDEALAASLEDLDLGSLKWYVDLRRWGSVPHGGFGLGFDRLLGYLAGVGNIREVVTFPRWVGRCDC